MLQKQFITFHLYPILIAYFNSVDNTEQYIETIMLICPVVRDYYYPVSLRRRKGRQPVVKQTTTLSFTVTQKYSLSETNEN